MMREEEKGSLFHKYRGSFLQLKGRLLFNLFCCDICFRMCLSSKRSVNASITHFLCQWRLCHHPYQFKGPFFPTHLYLQRRGLSWKKELKTGKYFLSRERTQPQWHVGLSLLVKNLVTYTSCLRSDL